MPDEPSTESLPVPKDGTVADRAARTVKTLRWWMVVPLPAAVITVAALTSPDGWREPFVRLVWLSWACVIIAFVHGVRKSLFNYADMREAWQKALETATGAGLAFLGLCLVIAALSLGLLGYARAQDVRTFVPANAAALLPQLRAVQAAYWPEYQFPSYFGALIEQESCISLRHSKCWNSRSQLKTDREEGAGLGQFTRAYRADGTLRFDAIAEVRALDPAGLKEFSWATVYSRADLSMKAILVKVKDCTRRLQQQTRAEPIEVLAFCDAAYNGGLGGLLQDRQLCGVTRGCNASQWFGQVERTSGKSRQKWQGYGKSAFEINREHVLNALVLRRPKYQAALGADLL